MPSAQGGVITPVSEASWVSFNQWNASRAATLGQREATKPWREMIMRSAALAAALAASLGLASTAFAQEPGFGGLGDVSKNQVPGPEVNKPTDPAAGNPGSAAQVPTAPEVQDDLYNGGANGAASGEPTGPLSPPPPQ